MERLRSYNLYDACLSLKFYMNGQDSYLIDDDCVEWLKYRVDTWEPSVNEEVEPFDNAVKNMCEVVLKRWEEFEK